jgi:AraC-like DNA-binding protein/ligand-binding sensor protein
MRNEQDILLSEKVRQLFNHFTELFNIRIAYFTPEGEEYRVGLNRAWCPYCTLLRRKLGNEALCLDSDSKIREKARASGEMIVYRCHGGLVEAVKPLFSDDELFGFVMIGQIRSVEEIPPGKLSQWNKKFANDELRNAFRAVPLISSATLSHLLPLFSSLVDLIITKKMIALLGRHPLVSVITRISEHPEEDLSLTQVAAMIGKSVSRTAHMFSEIYSKSFKEIQREIRMQKAVELLVVSKSMGIKEIASYCGYDDPLYFSRSFKRHFGITPSSLKRGTG